MENKNIYNLEKIRNFLKKSHSMFHNKTNKAIDLLLLFTSSNDIKQQYYQEKLSDYVVKLREGTEEYATVISFNEKDYVLNFELDKLVKSVAPKERKEFIKKELILYNYNVFSIKYVPDPVFWLKFLNNYLSRSVYETTSNKLNHKQKKDIAHVIEYLCLQFINYFEILKNPYVYINENEDNLLLGYCIDNNENNNENNNEDQRSKNSIFIFMKQLYEGSDAFSYNVFKNSKYTSFLPGMQEILKENPKCNIFIAYMGKQNALKNLCLYETLLKGLITLSFELEFVFERNSNILTNDVSFSLLKSENEIELYREIVDKEYPQIIAYILRVIKEHKKKK